MEETIEARVSPEKVWEAWERAHNLQTHVQTGQGQATKKHGSFRYRILAVDPGKSFSIVWKTLFVRLIFHHTVRAAAKGAVKGSEIRYRVEIKGFFAWPVRWWLGAKIQSNIRQVLKAIVAQLERESKR